MKLLIVPFLFMLVAGCAATNDVDYKTQVFDTAKLNFTYTFVYSKIDEPTYHDITAPFETNCVGFAYSLRQHIGGDIWYVIYQESEKHGPVGHVILISDGWVFDNYFDEPVKLELYKARWYRIKWMDRKTKR